MDNIHFKFPSEVTFKTVADVRSGFYELLIDKKINQISLDLSDVVHCDSAGMALLIEAQKLCKKNNKVLEIMGMSPETKSLADFCGIRTILEN